MSKWKSIMQSDPSASYISGRRGALQRHHCIHGTAGRAKAEADGLYVMLTPDEHMRLHDHGDHDRELQQAAQLAWMKRNGDEEAFRRRFGKSYL